MARVAKITDRKLGIEYGYMYELRTEADVLEYWENVGQPRWRYGFADFLKAAQNTSHATTPEGSLLYEVHAMTGKPPLLIMGRTIDSTHLGMVRSLPVAVNSNGGYFAITHHEVTDSHDSEDWILPGAQLKISQWPNGRHYYARIGDEDVVVNGRNKWDTKQEAEYAAKMFASNHSIRLESNPGRGR